MRSTSRLLHFAALTALTALSFETLPVAQAAEVTGAGVDVCLPNLGEMGGCVPAKDQPANQLPIYWFGWRYRSNQEEDGRLRRVGYATDA